MNPSDTYDNIVLMFTFILFLLGSSFPGLITGEKSVLVSSSFKFIYLHLPMYMY